MIETERLILRPFEERDRAALEAIMGDAQVRRFFPARATPEDVDRFLQRVWHEEEAYGFCFRAAEHKADKRLAGIIGMARLDAVLQEATGAETEIGWQLHPDFWGQGLAPEGAQAWLDHGWRVLLLPEVVALTAAVNRPSQRVMEKLGMRRDPARDFDHPRVPEGPLRRHVLYRIDNPRR